MSVQVLNGAAYNRAQTLNQQCFCITLDAERLRVHLDQQSQRHGLTEHLRLTRPHLFSSTVVFVGRSVAQAVRDTIAAIERVIAVPGYQAQALARAPAVAAANFGPRGVLMGYDFHLDSSGPRLIEINTNAGGAWLNGVLARAQQACCAAVDQAFPPDSDLPTLEQRLMESFICDWRLQRGEAALRTLVVVDDAPTEQYLAPEFELFAQMARRAGHVAHVVDAAALIWRDGRLWQGDEAIDLVYNRLTDFYLAEPKHEALRAAYLAGAVVLTPHPRAHALYADKRNLVSLSDADQLAQWQVSAADRALLAAVVPNTRLVTRDQADALWADRSQWFFKPVAGYGAKAAYRGDKLTRRVWSEILDGDFVAQALVPPSERQISQDGARTELKFDLRAYVYAGQVQLFAARMYQGQTTNFRTVGGGFAPVVIVDDAPQ